MLFPLFPPNNYYTVSPTQAQITFNHILGDEGGLNQITQNNILGDIQDHNTLINAFNYFNQNMGYVPNFQELSSVASATIPALQQLNGALSATANNFNQLTNGQSVLTQQEIDQQLNNGQSTSEQVFGLNPNDVAAMEQVNPNALSAFTFLDPGNQPLTQSALQQDLSQMNDRLSILQDLSSNPQASSQFPQLPDLENVLGKLDQGMQFLVNNSANAPITGQTLTQAILGQSNGNPYPYPHSYHHRHCHSHHHTVINNTDNINLNGLNLNGLNGLNGFLGNLGDNIQSGIQNLLQSIFGQFQNLF